MSRTRRMEQDANLVDFSNLLNNILYDYDNYIIGAEKGKN